MTLHLAPLNLRLSPLEILDCPKIFYKVFTISLRFLILPCHGLRPDSWNPLDTDEIIQIFHSANEMLF